MIPPDHGLTLDDIAGPHFRGFFAKNSVCFYPELDDIFYNSRFLAEVKSYWSAEYAKPTLMLFNICGPHNTGLAPHLDAVTFRGVRIENTPVWLQNIMGKSGLFNDYLVKMAQIITWWYRGSPGGFTYWPDGPFEPPQSARRADVEPRRRRAERDDVPPRRSRRAARGSRDRGHEEPLGVRIRRVDDSWVVTTDGEVIRRYRPEQIRFLVHWNAEVYADMDEVKKVMDHTDDLTHEQVVDTLARRHALARCEGRRAVRSLARRRLHPGADAHLRRVGDDRLAHRRRDDAEGPDCAAAEAEAQDPDTVAPAEPRRLTPKGEATRARLIELAAEVFAEQGYAAASIRDLASRSGLSSGAIYGTFRGKAELLAEAVDAIIASDVEALPAAVTQLTLPEIDVVPVRARAAA